jgi:hypothetical protein
LKLGEKFIDEFTTVRSLDFEAKTVPAGWEGALRNAKIANGAKF